MEMKSILMFGVGLVIMTIAIKMVSESFQYIVRPIIKKSIGQIKLNSFYNYFLGLILASSIHSGFSATVMFLGFLNSGLMNVRQLLFVSLGAEFGILWIFLLLGAIDIQFVDYYLIIFGFIPMAYGRRPILESLGRLSFSIGFLLLGYRFALQIESLNLIFIFLKPYFSLGITMGVAYLVFFLIRSELTLLIINLVAYKMGLFEVPQMVIFSFGVFLAERMIFLKTSLNSNLNAKRLSSFFLIINLITLGFYLLGQNWVNQQLEGILQYLVARIDKTMAAEYVISLVYASIILSKTFLSIFLEKPLFYVLEKYLFKNKEKEPQKLVYSGSAYQLSPVIAIEHVLKEDMKMAATLQSLLSITKAYLEDEEEGLIQRIKKYERILDNVQIEVFDYLSQVMVGHLNLDQGKQVRALARIADELESGSDCCKSIGLSMGEIRKMGVQLEGGMKPRVVKLFDQFLLFYDSFFNLFTGNGGNSKELRRFSEEFEESLVHLKKDYLTWLKMDSGSDYNLEASVKVEDVIRALKQLKGHCQNILEAYYSSF